MWAVTPPTEKTTNTSAVTVLLYKNTYSPFENTITHFFISLSDCRIIIWRYGPLGTITNDKQQQHVSFTATMTSKWELCYIKHS